MRWWVLFLLISSYQFSSAQENKYVVRGSILNSITDAPIENVNIIIKNSGKGVTTNELGEFILSYNSLPIILEVSHISYKSKNIVYEFHPIQDLRFTLDPEIKELSGITISSQKIDTLYSDEEYSILDYELVDEGILILIFKARLSRAELIIINNKNQTTHELKILPGKPLALIRDCLDRIHIILKDKISQITITENSIHLMSPYSHDEYKKVMSGCLFMIGKKIYFEDYAHQNLMKQLFYIDTTDRSEHLLAEIANEEKLGFLRDNPENNGILFSEGNDIENLKGLPGDPSILASIRYLEVTTRFNKMAYLSDIYAPIFKLGDSICVFNHPKSQIEIYNNEDSLVSDTDISYHIVEKKNQLTTLRYAFFKPTKWEEKVFIDEERKKAFAIFRNINGTRDLKEIDLQTGSLTFLTTIPYPYVEKIKINNGYLYYLYRGWGEGEKKKLFRQQIF